MPQCRKRTESVEEIQHYGGSITASNAISPILSQREAQPKSVRFL
jgi:hypothetical protein